MIQVKGTLSNVPGLSNYASLSDKPQINGVELLGNKNSEELGLVSKDQMEEYQHDTMLEFEDVGYCMQELKEDVAKSIEETNGNVEELRNQTQALQEMIDGLVDGNEVAY